MEEWALANSDYVKSHKMATERNRITLIKKD